MIKHSHMAKINIDTLTRLMKEFCFSNDLMFDVRYHTNYNPRTISIMTYGKDSRFFSSDTEFEAILKATDWVIREKGLI